MKEGKKSNKAPEYGSEEWLDKTLSRLSSGEIEQHELSHLMLFYFENGNDELNNRLQQAIGAQEAGLDMDSGEYTEYGDEDLL